MSDESSHEGRDLEDLRRRIEAEEQRLAEAGGEQEAKGRRQLEALREELARREAGG